MINLVLFFDGRLNPLKTALVGANNMVEESREDWPDSLDPDSPSDIVSSSFEIDAADALDLLLESRRGSADRFFFFLLWL